MTKKIEYNISSNKYRPEIDGLRAIAVIAVIIFHFNKYFLPNGFLGVDVFFVISGYVISNNLISKASFDFKDFILDFYSRRIKRIMPALAFYVLVNSILISMISPSANESLKSGIAALFGLSNLYFLQNNDDYFGNNLDLNIFTQTWSLGVEEQFYLFYPILFWLLYVNNRKGNWKSNSLNIWMIGLISFSLILYIIFSYFNQIIAFYSIFTRFWELGVGCLIALNEKKCRGKLLNNIFLSKLTSQNIVLPVLMILFSFPIEYTSFKTIAVVILTAILIIRLEGDGYVNNILTSKILVYIGLISFSLYLWHWSVLVISNWSVGISLITLPLQIIILVSISAFSYIYVERPMREIKDISHLKIISYSFISCAVITLIIAAMHKSGDIFLGQRESNWEFTSNCRNGVESSNWIVGDSHASIYSQLFSNIYSGHCAFLSEIDSTGNSFLFSRKVINSNSAKEGGKSSVEVVLIDPLLMIDLIKKNKPRLLFIAIYWNGYFLDNSKLFESSKWTIVDYKGPDGVSLTRDDALKLYLRNIGILSDAVKSTTDIMLLLPEPDFNWTPYGVTRGECNRQWFMTIDYPQPLEKICSSYLKPAVLPLKEFQARTDDLINEIRTNLSHIENLKFFDVTQILCDTKTCSTHSNGIRLYMDDDHINSAALEKIKPVMLQALESVGHSTK